MQQAREAADQEDARRLHVRRNNAFQWNGALPYQSQYADDDCRYLNYDQSHGQRPNLRYYRSAPRCTPDEYADNREWQDELQRRRQELLVAQRCADYDLMRAQEQHDEYFERPQARLRAEMDAEILRQDAELLRRGDLDWTLLNDGERCPEQFRADRLERHQELMCRVREAHRVLGETEACRCRLLDRYDRFTRGACPLYDDADPWDRGDEEMRRFSSAFARAKTEEGQARATIAILYAGAVEAAALEDRQDLEARTAIHVAEAGVVRGNLGVYSITEHTIEIRCRHFHTIT